MSKTEKFPGDKEESGNESVTSAAAPKVRTIMLSGVQPDEGRDGNLRNWACPEGSGVPTGERHRAKVERRLTNQFSGELSQAEGGKMRLSGQAKRQNACFTAGGDMTRGTW